jgi:hypothetical protein
MTLPPTPHSTALLYLYLSHAFLLESIPLASRAQRLQAATKELSATLESFLTGVYGSLTSAIDALPLDDTLPEIDLDGRLFFLLVLDALTCPTAPELSDLLGPTVFARVSTLWTNLNPNPVDLSALRAAFPSESTELPPLAIKPLTTLLPFSNPVIDKHLTTVHVSTSEKDTPATTKNALADDTVFDDRTFWENPKPVLPTHLGGPAPVALDARARKKRDRKEQRFSASRSFAVA